RIEFPSHDVLIDHHARADGPIERLWVAVPRLALGVPRPASDLPARMDVRAVARDVLRVLDAEHVLRGLEFLEVLDRVALPHAFPGPVVRDDRPCRGAVPSL